jgi:methionyl-tRNA synthetase
MADDKGGEERSGGVQVISIEQFGQVDLRAAKVLEAERVPGTARLTKLQVDLGGERRQLVAGIAEAYEPETLVGKTIIMVANLKPARLRGVESQGMLLAATPEGGQPILATFETDVSPGTKVR